MMVSTRSFWPVAELVVDEGPSPESRSIVSLAYGHPEAWPSPCPLAFVA